MHCHQQLISERFKIVVRGFGLGPVCCQFQVINCTHYVIDIAPSQFFLACNNPSLNRFYFPPNGLKPPASSRSASANLLLIFS
ncbi:MAG: hypothetical protein ACI861_001948, partial [Paracoccaceae bacterium]